MGINIYTNVRSRPEQKGKFSTHCSCFCTCVQWDTAFSVRVYCYMRHSLPERSTEGEGKVCVTGYRGVKVVRVVVMCFVSVTATTEKALVSIQYFKFLVRIRDRKCQTLVIGTVLGVQLFSGSLPQLERPKKSYFLSFSDRFSAMFLSLVCVSLFLPNYW